MGGGWGGRRGKILTNFFYLQKEMFTKEPDLFGNDLAFEAWA